MNIQERINQISKKDISSEPIIFDLKIDNHKEKLLELLNSNQVNQISNDYIEQLKELFAVKNPTLVYTPDFEKQFKNSLKENEEKAKLFLHGKWVFYPWLSVLVHVLDEEDFFLVRTARNRYLISPEEQQVFYDAVVGIGGLSVGNSVALTIVLQGGAKHIKLADFDNLALSNTNRVRAGVQNLGLPKVEVTARQIYELNPYATVEIFQEGLNPENLESFFSDLDIIIDELDNIAIKYLIREQAKKYKVPLVMAADNGDNAVVDIERYDLNPQQEFFHGRIGNVTYGQLKNLNKFEIGQTIAKHIGLENVTEKTLHSFLEMGKTIVSWPQLGGAALLNGSAVAYCVRKILNKEHLENNRALISLDEKLIPNYNSLEEIEKRKKTIRNFQKILKL